MLEFVQLLKQRYQSVLLTQKSTLDNSAYRQRIDQLILAEAFLRKGQLTQQPLHIAIIGPTQAGKSSLVNVLLGNAQAAVVSPLAGYTVHSQGFCYQTAVNDCQGLQDYFGHFQQLSPQQLPRDRYDCYALSESLGDTAFLPPCVLWDTPDFDSIDSAIYREGVLRAIALADILILVVSKEKYADQSVWDMMSTLQALQQPTLICLNKLPEGSEQVLIASLHEKWHRARTDTFPDVIPLAYQKSTGQPSFPLAQKTLLTEKKQAVKTNNHARFADDFIQQCWQTWLEPVLAEHKALQDWQDLVNAAIEQALAQYQRDYLNHPHHYETFQQALAELLVLLEVPGLAGLLTGARSILTWPVRQFLKLKRKRWQIAQSSLELVLLNQIAEHALIELSDNVLDKAQSHQHARWWHDFNSLLRSTRAELLTDFQQAAQQYHLDFQQDVEKAAYQLYVKLQEQPLLLNSLRAMRATTDATVIALTLYAGGVGIHDLVIAPAMLAVTTLLTESAIGGYMQKVALELKQQQLDEVKQRLFVAVIMARLQPLPLQLKTPNHFHITPQQVQHAHSQLQKKPHGLRLL